MKNSNTTAADHASTVVDLTAAGARAEAMKGWVYYDLCQVVGTLTGGVVRTGQVRGIRGETLYYWVSGGKYAPQVDLADKATVSALASFGHSFPDDAQHVARRTGGSVRVGLVRGRFGPTLYYRVVVG